MRQKQITRKLKNGKTEKIIVKRYASGEFLITSIPSYAKDRPDTDYVHQDTFKIMAELNDAEQKQNE